MYLPLSLMIRWRSLFPATEKILNFSRIKKEPGPKFSSNLFTGEHDRCSFLVLSRFYPPKF